jgi:hypothetical protein
VDQSDNTKVTARNEGTGAHIHGLPTSQNLMMQGACCSTLPQAHLVTSSLHGHQWKSPVLTWIHDFDDSAMLEKSRVAAFIWR